MTPERLQYFMLWNERGYGLSIDEARECLAAIERLQAELAAAQTDKDDLVKFYQAAMARIAEAVGIDSPLQLIARAKNDKQTYADILIEVLQETLADKDAEMQRLRTDLQMARGGTVLEVELAEAQNRATKAEAEVQRLRKLARRLAIDARIAWCKMKDEIGPIVEDKDK